MEYRRKLARELVRESVVLLKNEDRMLPLKEGTRAALFGRAQIDTFVSGNGSGAAHREGCKSILQALSEHGLLPDGIIADFYERKLEAEAGTDPDVFDWSMAGQYVNSGVMYEIFGRYHAPKAEFSVPEAILREASERTDTAIWILGRNSGGEECDRHLEGDYELTDSEKRLAKQICGSFSKVILVLNINGFLDLSWTKEYESLKAILFLGIPGEEGADALAELLLGKSSPCGKLVMTIAENYADYPASEDFTWDKDDAEKLRVYESYGLDAMENGSNGFRKSPVTVYREGIYTGYRYFTTFGKKPQYPFGYGLSYTDFTLSVKNTEKMADKIVFLVEVENTGQAAGKEVVQIYLSAEAAGTDRAGLELAGWEKTKLLQPGEAVTLRVEVPWRRLACYDEKQAAWTIFPGHYVLSAGTSSEDMEPVLEIPFIKPVVVEQCSNRLGVKFCNRDKLQFLKPQRDGGKSDSVAPETCLSQAEPLPEIPAWKESEEAAGSGTETMQLIRSLSIEQLASLCVGYGPGVPFAAFRDDSDPAALTDENGRPLTVNDHPSGFSGYVSPAIPEKGIHSVFYKDGPAGIGAFAWPSEMLLACSFDRKLWYAFGEEMGRECEQEQVDVWLAPALNLLRHPLGGRNFEYFSEDPLLTGICGCEITKGVQENHPVLVCAKHFAANEQETWRRGNSKRQYDAVDSILEERALRELYLEPFRLLVREAGLRCIMTSFNKINGTFAAGSAALCTGILREEWKFDGVVVTDWGDMDVVVDGADAVHAGNDIVMPGGPPVIRQILKGYQEKRVTREEMERSAQRLLRTFPRVQTENDEELSVKGWEACWIGTKNRNDEMGTLPPELFQKKFRVFSPLVKASLRVSALGIYSACLNGERIGDSYFTPGYTHYESYVQYQTYDVTSQVKSGDNTLQITVANGWWSGRLGNRNNIYGNRRGVAAELQLFYDNGSCDRIGTDETWQVTTDSPVRYAEFYNGETIDLRCTEEKNWHWESVCRLGKNVPAMKAHFGAYVKEEEHLIPVRQKGTIYDFGQNHAGVVRLCVRAESGTVITIRHGEILSDDGTLFTDNLRDAKQTLTLICGAGQTNMFKPQFTFMGFRYAEVTATAPVEIITIESAVMTSDAKAIGSFRCSDPLLNRLQQNIQWGQKSNFIDIPTDCPQRDERMGWTGDIAVFARTAAFNRDIGTFMRKWLYDLRLYQRENGAIPVTIPENRTYQPTSEVIPIAIWGDAATMVPWAVYLAYGEKDFLADQYLSMSAYTNAEISAAASTGEGNRKYIWDENPYQYGDWCAAGETYEEWIAKGKYLATAYLANSVNIMCQAARALGKAKDAKYYEEIHEKIQAAFTELCILPDGRLEGDFQSNYVCALYFNLIPESMQTSAAARLAQLVREGNYTVRTGFAGTPYLLFALADHGYVEEAYRVLQNENCPGWLYTVKAGATTMWERWDALDENGHFYAGNGADMVSFNHYAYGAVGDFFYRRILGIEPVGAGYRGFRIRPIPGGTLTWAEGKLKTRFGKIQVRWEISEDTFCLEVDTPVGIMGEIVMPNGESYRTDGGFRTFECSL